MPSAPISLREYAKRRGVSAMAVSRAVAKGRLSKSVVRDGGGQPKIADAELADREWDATTDLTKAPGYVRERAEVRKPPPLPPSSVAVVAELDQDGEQFDVSARPGMSLSEASAIEKVWKARCAELDFRERSGELVRAKDVADRLASVFTRCRSKLLGVPSRAKQALPHLSVPDLGMIEQLVREALEDLAHGGDVFAPDDEGPREAAG